MRASSAFRRILPGGCPSRYWRPDPAWNAGSGRNNPEAHPRHRLWPSPSAGGIMPVADCGPRRAAPIPAPSDPLVQEPVPMSMAPEEKALIDLWRQGDEDAARKIVDRYIDRLLVLARRRISQRLAPRVDAEDIVQSVFRTFFGRLKD